jgi:hypothetical protein
VFTFRPSLLSLLTLLTRFNTWWNRDEELEAELEHERIKHERIKQHEAVAAERKAAKLRATAEALPQKAASDNSENTTVLDVKARIPSEAVPNAVRNGSEVHTDTNKDSDLHGHREPSERASKNVNLVESSNDSKKGLADPSTESQATEHGIAAELSAPADSTSPSPSVHDADEVVTYSPSDAQPTSVERFQPEPKAEASSQPTQAPSIVRAPPSAADAQHAVSLNQYDMHIQPANNNLKQHLEESLLANLNNMSDDQLRAEINRLAYELIDRSKWEGMRLHDCLIRVETEVSKKYGDLLEKQR